MPVVGVKPVPVEQLHGALQWTGTNQLEFAEFVRTAPQNVQVQPDGSLWINSGFGQYAIPADGWLVTDESGGGNHPAQMGAAGATVVPDEEFGDRFETSDDQPRAESQPKSEAVQAPRAEDKPTAPPVSKAKA